MSETWLFQIDAIEQRKMERRIRDCIEANGGLPVNFTQIAAKVLGAKEDEEGEALIDICLDNLLSGGQVEEDKSFEGWKLTSFGRDQQRMRRRKKSSRRWSAKRR